MRFLPCLSLFVLSVSFSAADEPLWQAKPFTAEKSFTGGVEGAACDREGSVFAVNFARQQTIGKITPAGVAEVWVTLSGIGTGNGIRFDKAGLMYVADYKGHNILRIDPASKKVSVFANEPAMHQPNDIAMAPDGTLYASDPDWKNLAGQIWRIGTNGKVTLAAKDLGTANGIEVSPDGKTLYLNETKQRNVWSFDIGVDGALSNKHLIKQFPDFGFDGMRCDVDGNLYITRNEKGTVIKMTPKGEVLQEIGVLGKGPTNLCFGGPDGCTVYVTEAEKQRLVSFRVDRPGREWGGEQK